VELIDMLNPLLQLPSEGWFFPDIVELLDMLNPLLQLPFLLVPFGFPNLNGK
jgi:hypothetical protein